LQIFVCARGFSNEHQFGAWIANAKNDLVSKADQMRTLAAREDRLL
jgi:hypothetical protein